jgi:hypothetical protein
LAAIQRWRSATFFAIGAAIIYDEMQCWFLGDFFSSVNDFLLMVSIKWRNFRW